MGRDDVKNNAMKRSINFEEFLKAVKYCMVNEHNIPEIVADEFFCLDKNYFNDQYERYLKSDPSENTFILELVDDYAPKPNEKSQWREIGVDEVVLTIDDKLNRWIDEAHATGLYGEDRADTIMRLLCRGVESVMPILGRQTSVRR